MISLQRFMIKLCRIPPPKPTTISGLLNRSLTTTSTTPNVESPSTPDPETLAIQLSNCSCVSQLDQIYCRVIRTQFLHLYPAPFHWNNLIRSYTRRDAPTESLFVYVAMSRAGVLPDCYTIPIVLKTLCQLYAVDIGRQLHSVAVRIGLDSNEFCESGFINLYSKAGEFENARKVFDQNAERKLGSWNAIIAGLSQSGRAKEAIDMFIELRRCGLLPDDVTMVSVTSACGGLGDLRLALQLHKCVYQAEIAAGKSDLLMLNSLVDMYGKCGRMDLAYRVFKRMKVQNVSSWTSMIVGYAMHGHVDEALECFRCMREAGVRPNHVTFVGALSACVHGGTVQEGRYYFEMMKKDYGINPRLQHYGCMVDLLGKAGLLQEARKMVEEMPMKANSAVWGCLMGACEKHGNVEMGEWVAKHLQQLEPWNDGAFVVLSNIYASRGLWKEVERVRRIMHQRKLAKVPGYSLAGSAD
ncbi:PREDICTED: pentatricopeptide repeat-containing protein At1g77170 [Fragaria vesca subsp. vesca]|uniref:pentatricopeptide repeat-containing protein At1g77170 n=1 Tax=Fragaria vesca subsp. vesca TaxID=101020 RepID=UPI0002C2F5C6|nr:PREDICTED: pentatricopeptide repeat-containing protein At1g77170 [Fragaria vesca subsp. vesca]